jgi:hypothetical protein
MVAFAVFPFERFQTARYSVPSSWVAVAAAARRNEVLSSFMSEEEVNEGKRLTI